MKTNSFLKCITKQTLHFFIIRISFFPNILKPSITLECIVSIKSCRIKTKKKVRLDLIDLFW